MTDSCQHDWRIRSDMLPANGNVVKYLECCVCGVKTRLGRGSGPTLGKDREKPD